MAGAASSFRELEHAGWEKIHAQYHDGFARLTTQAVPALLDAVKAGPGTKLLDVATGPGYAAAAAAERGAEATGVDFAASMVATARRRYPQVRFQEGDAEALAFPDASFDAVTMNFGMLHLGRPDQAMAEARRVLRPGGRFAFTVWARPEEALGMGIVLAAIRKHGDPNAPIPAGPPFFRFSDEAECHRSLSAAGFASTRFEKVPQTWRLAEPATLWEYMLGSTVRTGALLRAQAPAALEAIRAEVVAASKSELPMPAVLASATK